MENLKNLNIKSVMNPQPYSIGATQSLASAKEVMEEHGIRHLPVLEGGSLVGVITDRDVNFARAVDQVPAQEILVRDSFTPEPYIVDCETKISEVSRTMAHQHIGCALVVENNKLIGIFTAVDACRLLSEVLSGKLEN